MDIFFALVSSLGITTNLARVRVLTYLLLSVGYISMCTIETQCMIFRASIVHTIGIIKHYSVESCGEDIVFYANTEVSISPSPSFSWILEL